ncbi:MFS transporter [Cellulomonas sp. Leaf395]|uniref:MFS transporter n=1 Tax=Cellulomonas sp. Leaf395 TaxID=1736362 RepID=UPI0006F78828|nr:MFS transporter [Cellulomonas sp. Leaf395]KQS97298.1 MFS transporter [Cellulomonas sp. Leaf395]
MSVVETRAGAREWTGLAVLALPCLVVSMGSNVLHLALPGISGALGTTNEQLLWIVDGYVFLLAGSLMTMGALADRIGRRRLLLIGGGAYGALSLVAALSTTPEMLIVVRMLLGVAGATLMPSTLSLIRSMFTDQGQRTTALGVWTASFALGGVIGPLVGGVLLGAFWWGSVFFLAPPVMLLLVVLGPRLLPEFRGDDSHALDVRSFALSLVSVLLLVYGITRLAESGPGPQPLAALVVGSAVGARFLSRQRRRPTFGLDLFRCRAFTLPVVTNAVAFFVLYGMQFLLAQYLQLVLGLSPLEAGLWTIPSALGYLVGSAIAPHVAHRLSPGSALGAGLLVSAVGFGLLVPVPSGGGLTLYVVASVILSVGLAPVYVVATGLAVSAAPEQRAGIASALLETCTNLGGALGIAVLGSVAGIVFRAEMRRSPLPGVPTGDRSPARGTIAGAVDVARDLPASTAGPLLDAAGAAFGNAFQVTQELGAGLLVTSAISVVVLLRRISAG